MIKTLEENGVCSKNSIQKPTTGVSKNENKQTTTKSANPSKSRFSPASTAPLDQNRLNQKDSCNKSITEIFKEVSVETLGSILAHATSKTGIGSQTSSVPNKKNPPRVVEDDKGNLWTRKSKEKAKELVNTPEKKIIIGDQKDLKIPVKETAKVDKVEVTEKKVLPSSEKKTIPSIGEQIPHLSLVDQTINTKVSI